MAIKKAVILIFALCLLAFGVHFALIYTGVTFRATGLELTQEDLNIKARWDKTDCDGYIVTVFKGETKIEEAITKSEHFTIENTEADKEYYVQVEAIDDEKKDISAEDAATISIKKLQELKVTSDSGEVFTGRSFSLSAEADGNIKYKSDNREVATVSQDGKVKLKGDGTADITIVAEETEEYCTTTATVTVHSNESYDGELPKLDNAIAGTAKRFAWPYGTAKSVYKYGGGNPTPYFKEAIGRVYPNHARWRKQCRLGASCDVFVGTCVRASGYDSNFPRGLDEDYSYLPNSSKFKKVSPENIQSGDIMIRKGHIQIYIEDDEGTGYIANAHYKLKTYGIIEKKNPKLSRYTIYHPVEECVAPVTKGDEGENAEKVQNFLAWSGFFSDDVDGKFGTTTEDAVKAFQEAAGSDVTGKFGETSLKNAKEYKINSIEIKQ